MEKSQIAAYNQEVKYSQASSPNFQELSEFKTHSIAKDRTSQSVERWMTWILSALVFMTPWVFTHYTYEYYESTKNTFFVLGSIILAAFWAYKVVREKKMTFVKTPFDLGVLIYLLSMIISTVFSIYKPTSVWGYLSRYTGGLISALSLVFLFYFTVNNVTKKHQIRKITKSLVVSLTLLAIFVIFKAFGLFEGIFEFLAEDHPSLAFLQNPVFTTIGSPNAIPVLFLLVLPLALSFVSKGEKKSDGLKGIVALIGVCFLILAIGITSYSNLGVYSVTIWGVVLGLITYSFINKLPVNSSLIFKYTVISVITIFSLLFAVIPSFRESITKDLHFSRYRDVPFDTTWSVITETYKQHEWRGFLIGTGPDTYAYDFARFRPFEQNNQINWNQNYTRGTSQVYELLTNTGIFGFSSFMCLFFFTLVFFAKKLLSSNFIKEEFLLWGLGISTIVFFIINFVTYLSFTVFMTFWLVFGLFVSLYYLSNARAREKFEIGLSLTKSKVIVENGRDIVSKVLLGFIFVFLGIASFYILQNYVAEIQFKKSLVASSYGDLDKANDNIIKALEKYDSRDYYHKQLAYVALQALKLNVNEVSAQDVDEAIGSYRNYLVNLIKEEVGEAISLNSLDPSSWEAAAITYKQLVDLTGGQLYGNETLYAVSRAIELNPNNPDNYIILGYIYQYNADESVRSQAESIFFKAYTLRLDYPLSILALGNYLESVGKYEEAIVLYENSINSFYPDEKTQMNLFLQGRIEAVTEAMESEEASEELVMDIEEDITEELEDIIIPSETDEEVKEEELVE